MRTSERALAIMTEPEAIKKESPSLEELSEKGVEQELDSELEQPEEQDPISNYGWVCVACVFLINGHTWGLNSVGIPFRAGQLEHH